MFRNWERYDSRNVEKHNGARIVHLDIYDLVKTEHNWTAQDYSNGLHHIHLKYHASNCHYKKCLHVI